MLTLQGYGVLQGYAQGKGVITPLTLQTVQGKDSITLLALDYIAITLLTLQSYAVLQGYAQRKGVITLFSLQTMQGKDCITLLPLDYIAK